MQSAGRWDWLRVTEVTECCSSLILAGPGVGAAQGQGRGVQSASCLFFSLHLQVFNPLVPINEKIVLCCGNWVLPLSQGACSIPGSRVSISKCQQPFQWAMPSCSVVQHCWHCVCPQASSSFLLWNPGCRGREAVLPTLLVLDERQGLGFSSGSVQDLIAGGGIGWSLWSLWSCSLDPAPESSPDRAQQSLYLGTFPEPLSPAWPEVFAGVSQATANLGGISIVSAGEGGNPRQPRCYGCHRPS